MKRAFLLSLSVTMFLCSPLMAQQLRVEKPGVMIMPDRSAGPAKSVELSGMRNEFLSFQMGLRSDQPAELAHLRQQSCTTC